LSKYSVHFEKCQYVKAYDDDLAEADGSATPLALQHFVVFRLCPTLSCSSCDADGVNYGKYAVDVETYLTSMVQFQKEAFENKCKACDKKCNGNNNQNNGDDASDDAQLSSYCTSCSTECNWYNNLQSNGYLDASEYVECAQLAVAQNDDAGNADDAAAALYIGPRCTAKGKIVIGLFADNKCHEPVDGQDIETLLGAKLSYHMLNNTYSDEGACVSCKEVQDGNANDDGGNDDAEKNDEEDADNVNEMCENLYNSAAKCESKTGISVGFIQTSRDDGNDKAENQVENEVLACTFINSLIWNSYTETGEINTAEKQDVIIRRVTQKQSLSLSFVALALGSLVGLAVYLDKKIKGVEDTHPLVFRGKHTLT
jgi:hypothetical protein